MWPESPFPMYPSGVWVSQNVPCGALLQEPVLFGTTIMENIRFGKLGATDEEVYAAAREANAHEFITSFPEGYNTIVGESRGWHPARVCRAHGVRIQGAGTETWHQGRLDPWPRRVDMVLWSSHTQAAETGTPQGVHVPDPARDTKDPWCWDSSELARGPRVLRPNQKHGIIASKFLALLAPVSFLPFIP